MQNKKNYIRRTISIAPFVDETIEKMSRTEFGGNASAFIAHMVLHYTTCRLCLNKTAESRDSARAHSDAKSSES